MGRQGLKTGNVEIVFKHHLRKLWLLFEYKIERMVLGSVGWGALRMLSDGLMQEWTIQVTLMGIISLFLNVLRLWERMFVKPDPRGIGLWSYCLQLKFKCFIGRIWSILRRLCYTFRFLFACLLCIWRWQEHLRMGLSVCIWRSTNI